MLTVTLNTQARCQTLCAGGVSSINKELLHGDTVDVSFCFFTE